MFCYQCQEAAKGIACTGSKGVCGVTDSVIHLQDFAIHMLKGLAACNIEARKLQIENQEIDKHVYETLFKTITNVSFSQDDFVQNIEKTIRLRNEIKKSILENGNSIEIDHDSIHFDCKNEQEMLAKAEQISGEIDAPNEDIRSLRALIIYGLKGLAAYQEHAENLNYEDNSLYEFVQRALAATIDDSLSLDENIALVLETGKFGVDAMALLDKANTETYGNPEISEVNIGVSDKPGILISGHDLKDMEELLKQTDGTGVDVYTHSEMLPANYYPAFKKYKHFVGNYGNAWWQQDKEFEQFNGPILMTTNCLVPPKKSYIDRVYTTGPVQFDGLTHIADRNNGSEKDFSQIIEHAKKCEAPIEIETGKIVGGFAHNQVIQLADKVVDAVKSGDIKKFVVMAGCDGRQKSRKYYTEFAEQMPNDSVILTAGCAKFRYNKLELGDIGGIPRILDAGQCNDSYSLVVIALKLKEVFGLDDINELPIAYNIAWYEQKAVIVLLALLYLGVKNIHLGPTLPAFLSQNVTKVLVDNFGIAGISTVEKDLLELVG
jgi:hydroxylamine reductase